MTLPPENNLGNVIVGAAIALLSAYTVVRYLRLREPLKNAFGSVDRKGHPVNFWIIIAMYCLGALCGVDLFTAGLMGTHPHFLMFLANTH